MAVDGDEDKARSTKRGSPKAETTKPPKKRRPIWLRVLRGLGFSVLGVVVLLGFAVGYLHTSSGKERVRALVEKRLNEKVHGSAKVGKLDFALGGDLDLGDVHLLDEQGREVIGLSSLHVRPSWGELLGGKTIALDEVAVHGVSVAIVKDEAGGSNLKSLFVKDPNEKPREPLSKTILVRSLVIDDVDVTITDPTGTKIAISDASIAGELSALPANKDVHVAISKIGLGLSLEKSNGLALGVKNLSTGLGVDLVGGKGKATLAPLHADIALTPPGGTEKRFPVDLGGIEIDLGDGDVDVSLDELTTGALALASIDVKGKLGDGGLAGPPGADVVGLRVDAARINELLGKEVLATNIDIEAHVSGQADALLVGLGIDAGDAKVKLAGTLGLENPEQPRYDLELTATGLDTTKLTSPSLNVAPASVGSIALTLKGRGKTLPDADATAHLTVKDARARGIPIDSAEVDATVKGGTIGVERLEVRALDQKVSATGTYAPKDKDVDLTLHVSGDVGVALEKLKAAGVPVSTSLPKGLVKLDDGDLAVHVKGKLDGALDVDASASHLTLLGGRGKLDARASLLRGDPAKGEKPVTVKSFDATFGLSGLRLGNVLAMRGKRLPPGLDAAIDLDLVARGTVEDPHVDLGVHATSIRNDGGKRLRLDVSGKVQSSGADVTVSLRDAAAREISLLSIEGHAPLTKVDGKPKLDPGGPISVHVSLPERKLAQITEYLPAALLIGRRIPDATVALDVALEGSVARPSGTVDLDVHGALVPGSDALSPPIEQRAHLVAKLGPEGGASVLSGDLGIAIDAREKPLATAKIGARFGASPLSGGAATAKWSLGLAVGPREAATLPPLPAFAKLRSLGGTLSVALDAAGDARDVTAKLGVDYRGFLPPPDPVGLRTALEKTAIIDPQKGVLDAHVGVELASDETKVDVGVALRGEPLVTLGGRVALAGRGLIPRAKAGGLDPALDLDLGVPVRRTASLAWLKPSAALVPGDLSGAIHIGGRAKEPIAKGSLDLTHIAMADGTDGGATLDVDAGVEKILVGIGYGAPELADAPFTAKVEIPRPAIAGLSQGGALPVSVRLSAAKVPMTRLLPKVATAKLPVAPTGELSTDLSVELELEKREAGIVVARGKLGGGLGLTASAIPLPSTSRTFRDVAVGIRASEATVHIDRIAATESDIQEKKRTLEVSGQLELADGLKPKKVEVAISADKWLLFGTALLGKADAPRGTLTLQAKARVELDRPIKVATLDVDALEVSVPDRFEKAHQPEEVHAGDLVMLDEGKVALGKLAVPESVKAKAEAARAAAEAGPPTETVAAAPSAEEKGLDLDIHIAKGAKVLLSPLEMHPSGSLSIAIRGTERKTRGTLDMTGGELSLGGKMHPLKKGTLTFDEAHPTGWVDLWFDRPLPPWALRDVSEASGGKSIQIHMFGPLSDRRTVLAGAGSPGSLPDLLSMHNGGRERVLSQPDLAESVSVDFPEYGGLLVLSFMSVNLPHLLFLDRVAAWSDPDDDGRAFGHVEHFEGDRYFADGAGRVHATKRPFTPTRSEAELEVDYLFVNEPRTLFGVGVAGGSRGGGGPGIVFEWSSSD